MERVMRLIAILLTGVLAITTQAQNYFKEGTEWIEVNEDLSPAHITVVNKYYIEGDSLIGDVQALKMWALRTDVEESSPKLKAYLRVEGDKVWFWDKTDSSEPWKILYDFGMNAGDKETFYMIEVYNPNSGFLKSYQECTENLTNAKGLGLNLLTMAEYEDPDFMTNRNEGNVLPQRASVINGMGSVQGPLSNGYYFATGCSFSRVTKITYNQEEIYNREVFDQYIQMLEDETNGIINKGIDASPVSIQASKNKLTINGLTIGNSLTIYRIDGTMIYSCISDGETVTLTLPSGLYLIKSKDKTEKMLVK